MQIHKDAENSTAQYQQYLRDYPGLTWERFLQAKRAVDSQSPHLIHKFIYDYEQDQQKPKPSVWRRFWHWVTL